MSEAALGSAGWILIRVQVVTSRAQAVTGGCRCPCLLYWLEMSLAVLLFVCVPVLWALSVGPAGWFPRIFPFFSNQS